MLAAVQQDAVAYGQFRVVPEEYFLNSGVRAAMAVEPAHVTDAITFRVQEAATMLPK